MIFCSFPEAFKRRLAGEWSGATEPAEKSPTVLQIQFHRFGLYGILKKMHTRFHPARLAEPTE